MISPIFIVLTIISGMMVITAIHPVHSIIWLVITFISSALVFIQLQADFIALATLIIYVGAIAILFIFVLMMLNLSSYDLEDNLSSVFPLGIVTTIGMITLITLIGFTDHNTTETEIVMFKEFSTIQSIGSELYSNYGNYIILASLVLLVAMIGAIILSLDPSAHSKRQNSYIQIRRDNHYI
uniref:NADH-ubiquinone oxidoreductase chain 6 n=1 Tax=Stomolophus sp. CG-2019 TaxID=2576781 RepID=A0A4P9HL63_9CNID|nr:NADH dehydrogenase subunit 6 [Stomolophus sp. CG-2019]